LRKAAAYEHSAELINLEAKFARYESVRVSSSGFSVISVDYYADILESPIKLNKQAVILAALIVGGFM
jgi:hypothetical protein